MTDRQWVGHIAERGGFVYLEKKQLGGQDDFSEVAFQLDGALQVTFTSGQCYLFLDRRRICSIVLDRGMIAERQENERGASEINLQS